MPIMKRSNKWTMYFRKKGVSLRKSCATRDEAIRLEAECERCLKLGLPLPHTKGSDFAMTSETLFERTADKHWSDSDWGLVQIRRSQKILDIMGRDIPVNDISFERIDAVIQHFKKNGASASTLNKINATISKALNLGVDKGWVNRKPKMEWIKTDNGRHRYIIPQEEELMVEVLEKRERFEARDFFMFLMDTGMRRGEAMNLRARDVHLDKGRLDILKTKNAVPRSVPMTNRVKAIVAARVNDKKTLKNEKVFCLSENQIRTAWEDMRTDMELDDDKEFVLHCLRHSCASRLVQRGVQIQVVQQWLGHKTLAMTLRYAHLNLDNLMDAVSVLETDGIGTNLSLLEQ